MPLMDCPTVDWTNCYDGNWNSLIVPEAFAHPAKMAYGLLSRIIKHGMEQGYWEAGELLGDPFGGIGSTGLVASYWGLRSVSVELEPRFVKLAHENHALHAPRWKAAGDPQPVLVQGDSRRFAEIVGQVCGVVSSPPFVDSVAQSDSPKKIFEKCEEKWGRTFKGSRAIAERESYGKTPGQIGALPAGSLDAVVSSPPYAEGLGHLPSPNSERIGAEKNIATARYGQTPGNIGNLREGAVDAVVTSPPWESNSEGVMRADKFSDPEAFARQQMSTGNGCSLEAQRRKMKADEERADYGETAGQIGRDSGETYWQAMSAVYGQMHAALKPGGIAAIVLKDYVAKGRRVPLCDDSCRLLESLGFIVFERCRCWLVKHDDHPSLFGGTERKTTERKSFFRRLAEKKGSPRIDFEEVIWCRREAPCRP